MNLTMKLQELNIVTILEINSKKVPDIEYVWPCTKLLSY